MKVGFIGAGIVGQLAHMASFAQSPGCHIVALAELKPRLREVVAQRYGIPRQYESHSDLLADSDVEAVVVVTARPTLAPVALDCLAAGKHVLTEKPMAATVEQASRLVNEARRRGVLLAVGYMKRHDEGVQRAKQIVDRLQQTKELGAITYVRAHCFEGNSWSGISGHATTDEKMPQSGPSWPTSPTWLPPQQEADYAAFLNTHVHGINLLRYLLGRTPTVEYAVFNSADGRVAVLNFGGPIGILETGRFGYGGWDETYEIYFERGRLRVDLPAAFLRNVAAEVNLYRSDGQKELIQHVGPSWAFRRQAEAFISDIQERREPLASGVDALTDLEVVEEMWRMQLHRLEGHSPKPHAQSRAAQASTG